MRKHDYLFARPDIQSAHYSIGSNDEITVFNIYNKNDIIYSLDLSKFVIKSMNGLWIVFDSDIFKEHYRKIITEINQRGFCVFKCDFTKNWSTEECCTISKPSLIEIMRYKYQAA